MPARAGTEGRAVLGLLILPGVLLLALITLPLTEPYLWTAGDRHLEVIGVDYRPTDEALGLLIPAGFSREWLFQFGNTE